MDQNNLLNNSTDKIHTSMVESNNPNANLSETLQTQDFILNTQDTSESKDSSVYNLGQRGAFSNPYMVANQTPRMFQKNGSKPNITDYTRDNTIDNISQPDFEEGKKLNFGVKHQSHSRDLFSKSVQESQILGKQPSQMGYDLSGGEENLPGDRKSKDTVRSERAFPTISGALNNTLKDFFFVDEEDDESSIFEEFDMINC